MKTLGERLREERQKLKLTLKDLADKVDVSFGYLSQIERESGIPSRNTLKSIADALHVTPTWLETGREPKHPQEAPFGRDTLDFAQQVKGLDPHRRELLKALADQFEADQRRLDELEGTTRPENPAEKPED